MSSFTQLSTMRADTKSEDIKYSISDDLSIGSALVSTPVKLSASYTSTFDAKDKIEAPKFVLSFPTLKPLQGNFRLLQQWEGRVQEVRNDEFDAIIKDTTNPDYPDESVTISVEELSSDDIHLLSPGAVFYWSIGYADFPGRGRVRESKIRFRRLPGWTHKEIERAKNSGTRLAALFEAVDYGSTQA